MSILPPRKYEDEEEQRLADALNELGAKMLSIVDAACRLRTAPNEAKRKRAMMRTNLEQAAHNGMDALSYSKSET